MRYAFLACIFAFVLCAAPVCTAEKAQKAVKSAAEKSAAKEDASDTSDKLTEIDMGEEDERLPETEYGVNRPRLMPPGDSYDENTGLPNIVESNTAGEIE